MLFHSAKTPPLSPRPPAPNQRFYLAVTVPIVVFFAPFGSFLASHFHRLVLAYLVYALDTTALVSALALLEMDWQRWVGVFE